MIVLLASTYHFSLTCYYHEYLTCSIRDSHLRQSLIYDGVTNDDDYAATLKSAMIMIVNKPFSQGIAQPDSFLVVTTISHLFIHILHRRHQ